MGSCREPALPASYSFCPAMYADVAGVSQELKIFPFEGKAVSIQLPFPLGPFAYSPDGKAIYATNMNNLIASEDLRRENTRGLFKIEFNPTRVSSVNDLVNLGISGVAIAAGADKILISAGRQGICGLYLLNLADGNLKKVVETSCGNAPVGTWSAISLSPDATRATALRNHRLELVDIGRAEVSVMPYNLILGTWSPDGKWFAGISSETKKTILMDGHTLQRQRVMVETNLAWSPDSRYLLRITHSLKCGQETGSLEVVDVQTGGGQEIASSTCQVNRNTNGWVSHAP
jgi:WD40 repeat protein